VPARGDADGQRFRLFEAAGCLIANAALARPVLLVLVDLHWADKPTAPMLAHVVRSTQAERVLVLGTYGTRSSAGSPPWGRRRAAS
jgi:predicted ATPase